MTLHREYSTLSHLFSALQLWKEVVQEGGSDLQDKVNLDDLLKSLDMLAVVFELSILVSFLDC